MERRWTTTSCGELSKSMPNKWSPEKESSRYLVKSSKAANMWLGKWSAEARVEAMTSTPNNHSLQQSEAESLYHSTHGAYLTDLAKHIIITLVTGCSPVGFHNLVKGKLNYIANWKEGGKQVMDVMATSF